MISKKLIVKAPKRQRCERDCISQTFYEYVGSVAVYDRSAKKEDLRSFGFYHTQFIKSEPDLAREIVARLDSGLVFLDFKIDKIFERRHYMSREFFIKNSTLAQEKEKTQCRSKKRKNSTAAS